MDQWCEHEEQRVLLGNPETKVIREPYLPLAMQRRDVRLTHPNRCVRMPTVKNLRPKVARVASRKTKTLEALDWLRYNSP